MSDAGKKWLQWRKQNAEHYRRWKRRYDREYYDQNCAHILQRNRDRFDNDPEFKARKDAARDAFKARVRAGHVPAPPPIHRPIQGQSVRLYRSSEAARLIGCSATSLQNWEQQGWLPTAMQVRGNRVYTRKQIDLVAWFASINCHDHEHRTQASKIIYLCWEK